MAIELHVLSGSRAGERPAFEKSLIAIGRHPACDLQFDPNVELLVSSRHAEIHSVKGGGRVTIQDVGSRNGTFLNGRRIEGETELHDGDEIELGTGGPRLGVRIGASGSFAAPRVSTAETGRRSEAPVELEETLPPGGAGAVRATQPKASTEERVRVAVRSHTRSLRWTLLAALVLLVIGVGGAYWMGHRESHSEIEELRAILARNEADERRLLAQLDEMGDTTFANAMRRRGDSLRQRVDAQHAGGGGGGGADVAALRNDLLQVEATQQGLARMDLVAISRANDAGVAFLATEIAGTSYGGTAFGITPNGLLVTNRHNVRDDRGRTATRIAVKFANTSRYLHAKLLRVSEQDSVDLAILQIAEPGTYPTVSGVASSTAALEPGTPVVTIGFPHSLDLPMEGETAKTSLSGGAVSKHLSSLLQIDAYAGHGSSGSPVFDSRGVVVGVIWGGPSAGGGAGRITYALPSDALIGLLPPEAKGLIK
jgi:pSer/pThr/pTyr-binding forkhead associated (FHA) protein/S1-C subfamily serine protease